MQEHTIFIQHTEKPCHYYATCFINFSGSIKFSFEVVNTLILIYELGNSILQHFLLQIYFNDTQKYLKKNSMQNLCRLPKLTLH